MTKKTTGVKKTDVTLVQELADILDSSDLVELEYTTDDVNIRLSRAAAMPMMTAPPATPPPALGATGGAGSTGGAAATPIPPAPSAQDHPGAVSSPMVGTTYLAPEPGATQFIKVGDKVTSGQTLLIIEAMKVMNPITAPSAGVVSTILVTDGQPVEYGEALVIIE
jgi:acetyl-CoA carboxylase biotin carboxyl carrier protein